MATNASEDGEAAPDKQPEIRDKADRREIKGGIPYSTSPGVLKKGLDLMIRAERPDKFSYNFMETVLKLSGGSARSIPPFLKKMQFIGADGSPTILYSRFKTDSGRSKAAYEGLKNAFGELFRRNEYVYKGDENAVKDVIVEITGLKKADPVVKLMYASFDAVRSFISGDISSSSGASEPAAPLVEEKLTVDEDTGSAGTLRDDMPKGSIPLGLSYQINIVLPETENIMVFNAIFKSLRDNLLR